MKVKNFIRRVWMVVPFTVISCLAGCAAFNGRQAGQIQKNLENEFAAINQLPDSVSCRCDSTHKSGHALVFCLYSTNLSYQEIRNFYDSELASRGWRFKQERKLTDWGRDYGGKIVEYCKGEYKTSIEYFGEDYRSYGGNYALNLSWGMESLYEQWQGTACR